MFQRQQSFHHAWLIRNSLWSLRVLGGDDFNVYIDNQHIREVLLVREKLLTLLKSISSLDNNRTSWVPTKYGSLLAAYHKQRNHRAACLTPLPRTCIGTHRIQCSKFPYNTFLVWWATALTRDQWRRLSVHHDRGIMKQHSFHKISLHRTTIIFRSIAAGCPHVHMHTDRTRDRTRIDIQDTDFMQQRYVATHYYEVAFSVY